MSSLRKHSRLLLVAVACAALGAGISAIASAGAATTSSSGHSTSARTPRTARAGRAGALRRFAARAVHGSVVVHTRSGFATVTFDRGKVDSVNGRQLTITEATKTATYKTVTLTIPSTAKVRDNRRPATLSDVTAGQRVVVVVAPKQSYVIARNPRTA
jgi:hypothetical protein